MTVISGMETTSKAGNPMIELQVKVENGPKIFDYLVFTKTAEWKIDALRAAFGETIVPGEQVEIAEDRWVGKSARAELEYEDGQDGKKYLRIAAWLPAESQPGKPAGKVAAAKPAAVKTVDEDGDDILF